MRTWPLAISTARSNLADEVPELLDTRGVVYTKLRRSQDAITDLIKATKLDPSGPKYFHLRRPIFKPATRRPPRSLGPRHVPKG